MFPIPIGVQEVRAKTTIGRLKVGGIAIGYQAQGRLCVSEIGLDGIGGLLIIDTRVPYPWGGT